MFQTPLRQRPIVLNNILPTRNNRFLLHCQIRPYRRLLILSDRRIRIHRTLVPSNSMVLMGARILRLMGLLKGRGKLNSQIRKSFRITLTFHLNPSTILEIKRLTLLDFNY